MKRPPISRGELDVAQAVWELESGTVGEIHEHLSKSKAIDYTTVQTYLRRLEQKGYCRTRRVGRNKLYMPRVERRRVVGQMIEDLVKQFFDGEPVALMQHLIDGRGISSDDVARLRQVLDQWEAGTEKSRKGERP
jgi:predicted transcriptional regulator